SRATRRSRPRWARSPRSPGCGCTTPSENRRQGTGDRAQYNAATCCLYPVPCTLCPFPSKEHRSLESTIRELLDLFVRWTHVIAGIMWIGNSLLFNWLDRNLRPIEPPREGSQGKIWLLHSGAFYEVEKKLLPAGTPYPDKVHWFMFQNLTTWVSGICLLVIVYYMGGAAY